MLVVAAISVLALPLVASASSKNIQLSFEKSELSSVNGQKRVYKSIQDASRELCGSSNFQITRSLQVSRGNQECYEGTLTAAVNRLDNSAVKALHTN
jgi:UrcA family protein